jgi:hypothetical protein
VPTNRQRNTALSSSTKAGTSSTAATAGLKTIQSLRVVAAGHAFVQNLRHGQYEITADLPADDRVCAAFTELAPCL